VVVKRDALASLFQHSSHFLLTLFLLWKKLVLCFHIHSFISPSGTFLFLPAVLGTTFIMKSSLIFQALSLVRFGLAGYTLQDDYSPSKLVSMFDAYSGPDPTDGFGEFIEYLFCPENRG
jgi:hypothetical protein